MPDNTSITLTNVLGKYRPLQVASHAERLALPPGTLATGAVVEHIGVPRAVISVTFKNMPANFAATGTGISVVWFGARYLYLTTSTSTTANRVQVAPGDAAAVVAQKCAASLQALSPLVETSGATLIFAVWDAGTASPGWNSTYVLSAQTVTQYVPPEGAWRVVDPAQIGTEAGWVRVGGVPFGLLPLLSLSNYGNPFDVPLNPDITSLSIDTYNYGQCNVSVTRSSGLGKVTSISLYAGNSNNINFYDASGFTGVESFSMGGSGYYYFTSIWPMRPVSVSFSGVYLLGGFPPFTAATLERCLYFSFELSVVPDDAINTILAGLVSNGLTGGYVDVSNSYSYPPASTVDADSVTHYPAIETLAARGWTGSYCDNDGNYVSF